MGWSFCCLINFATDPYFQHLQRRPAQPGNFCNHYAVAFLDLRKNSADSPFSPRLSAAFGVFDNGYRSNVLSIAVTENTELLVFDILGIFGYPQVGEISQTDPLFRQKVVLDCFRQISIETNPSKMQVSIQEK